MRSAVGALVALALLLGIPGGALGSRVEAGAGSPFFTSTGRGNDGEGPVTLTLQSRPGVVTVRHLHFANGCALNGSTVTPSLRLDSSKHFDYVAHGFTVQGTFDHSFSQATGTAHLERGGCDSGVLTFTVTLG